jgi:hypothetical protein
MGRPLVEVRVQNVRWRQGAVLLASGLAAAGIAKFLILGLDNPKFAGKAFAVQQGYNVLLLGMAVASALRLVSLPKARLFENGILRTRRVLYPWSQVKYCRWTSREGELFVQLAHEVATYRFRAEETAAVTAALSRHAEVRDSTGAIIASPDGELSDAADLPPMHRRFQFGLRTLLIFTVFASSAASWAGIRAERARREDTAVSPLAPNYPIVHRRGTSIVGLDFTISPVKPNDAELDHLANLENLEWVDLSGAPVTDAGIGQLARVQTLKLVNLTGTTVTAWGIKELERRRPGLIVLAPVPPAGPPLR